MIVVGVDPGNAAGLARFEDGILVEALEVAGASAASAVAGWAPQVLVVEVPQIYRHTGKGDPNLLRSCFRVAYQCTGVAIHEQGSLVVEASPAEWKGQVPKQIHQARMRKRLAGREVEIFDRVGHNARDAIGLVLWHLGKM